MLSVITKSNVFDAVITLDNNVIEIRNGTEVIESDAFSGQKMFDNVAVIKFPPTLKKIGKGAFKGMKNLEKVDFYFGSLSSIPEECFMDCSNLYAVHAYTRPTGIIDLTDGQPADDELKFTEGLVILDEIGKSAFKGCHELADVEISAERIMESAFEDCLKLHFLDITNTILIQKKAFRHCENLEELRSLDISDDPVRNFDIQAFDQDNKICFFEAGKKMTYFKRFALKYGFDLMKPVPMRDIDMLNPDADPVNNRKPIYPQYITALNSKRFKDFVKDDILVLPDDVIVIGENAFAEWDIKGVVLSKDLYNIEKYAFYQCENLEWVYFSHSEILKFLDEGVFFGCRKLKRADLPESLQVIGFECFKRCTSLEAVHCGSNLMNIEAKVFEECPQLKDFKAHAFIEYIDEDAFPMKNHEMTATMVTYDSVDKEEIEALTKYWDNHQIKVLWIDSDEKED